MVTKSLSVLYIFIVCSFGSSQIFLACGGHPNWSVGTTETSVTSGEYQTTSSSDTSGTTPMCGNNFLDDMEECDHGLANANDAACTNQCKVATCGDGLVWNTNGGNEQCDDGNQEDFDFCSNDCKFPTCTDKIQNGHETDKDCGGACEGCAVDQACQTFLDCQVGYNCENQICTAPKSCRELLELYPIFMGKDGFYQIDPDGIGGNAPMDLFCDMSYEGGGWTRVMFDTFEPNVKMRDWNLNGVDVETDKTMLCGIFGSILGGYDNFGFNIGIQTNDLVTKQVELLGIFHEEVRLTADFIAIDSWDDEKAYAKINDEEVWNTYCNFNNNICNHLSSNNQCGFPTWNDAKIAFDRSTNHSLPGPVIISFGTELDQVKTDESWGIDNVAVYVR